MKTSAPPCGLYLKISADTSFQENITAIRQAAFVINRSKYEQNMHIVEVQVPGVAADEFTSGLIQLIQSQGLVAIVRGTPAMAKTLNADGVIVTDPAQIAEAQRELGEDKIIGLSCQLGRAEVEAALNLALDYIIVGDHAHTGHADPELVSWWSGRTENPCVAGGDVTNDTAALYVRAGAGFLDCSDYVWKHEKGVIQAVTNMLHAIDLAIDDKKAMLN